MSSQLRTIARNGQRAKLEAAPPTLDVLLFGSDVAPDDATRAERVELIAKFRALMAEYQESNAERLWGYFNDARNEYEIERDGQSAVMRLVDNVRELCNVEAEMRCRRVQPGSEPDAS
jgi:hypothetical protein